MSTSPSTRFMSGCNPFVQQARQDRLDALYLEDGRHNRDHEHHATYTGLWEKYGLAPCTDEDAA
jgi:hypothetical protein